MTAARRAIRGIRLPWARSLLALARPPFGGVDFVLAPVTIPPARRVRQHEATSGRQTLPARAYPMAAALARRVSGRSSVPTNSAPWCQPRGEADAGLNDRGRGHDARLPRGRRGRDRSLPA